MAGRRNDRNNAAKKKKKYRKFSDRQKVRVSRTQAAELFDYKHVGILQKLCTQQGKLFSRKRANNSAWSQRRLKTAVKHARYMALLPFVG